MSSPEPIDPTQPTDSPEPPSTHCSPAQVFDDLKRRCRGLARSIPWSVRNTIAASPLLSLATMTASVLCALFPSAQTIFVEHLTGSIGIGGLAQAFGWIVMSALVVGGYLGFEQMMFAFERLIQRKLNYRCYDRMDEALATLGPDSLADPEVGSSIRIANRALVDAKVAPLTVSLLSLAQALITVVSLVAVIWRTSPLAAIFMLLSMAPCMVAQMVASTVDERVWPKRATAFQAAAYRDDQLMHARAGTELASYDAQRRMAGWAAGWRRRVWRNDLQSEVPAIIGYGVCIPATAALIIGALIALMGCGAGPSVIAGGLVGILTGIASVTNVGYMVGMLFTSSVAVESYLDFLDLAKRRGNAEPAADGLRRDHAATRPAAGHLVVRDLAVTYPGAGHPTVSGIDLEAHQGEMVALVGANGAGKTTTMQGIMGMLPVTAGSVAVDGIDLARLGYAGSHRLFGLLTQDFGRYDLTVRDNLLIGLGDRPDPATDDMLWDALTRAHADGIVRRLPHGLDTQLGEQWGGVGLSGGEWQRLALARLFLRDAPIWVLDEPTSAIDAETEARIFQELRAHASDRITLVVSHRAWTLRAMDRIYVVDGGRIVEHGTYEELHRPGTRFRELFAFQDTETKEPRTQQPSAAPEAPEA